MILSIPYLDAERTKTIEKCREKSTLILIYMYITPGVLSRATRPTSHCVCRLVGHTFTFSMRTAFTAPTQLITAPAQLIIAPVNLHFRCRPSYSTSCCLRTCHRTSAGRNSLRWNALCRPAKSGRPRVWTSTWSGCQEEPSCVRKKDRENEC